MSYLLFARGFFLFIDSFRLVRGIEEEIFDMLFGDVGG